MMDPVSEMDLTKAEQRILKEAVAGPNRFLSTKEIVQTILPASTVLVLIVLYETGIFAGFNESGWFDWVRILFWFALGILIIRGATRRSPCESLINKCYLRILELQESDQKRAEE